MGYTTDFEGHFNLDRALALEHKTYLEKFSNTRRMKRNAILAGRLPDPVRDAAGLGIGEEGGYFVGAKGFAGQDHDSKSIIEHNDPPVGQPGLWCQWVPATDDEGEATRIEWNGGEKFYYYVEWLEYLIAHFLKPWGYTLNGLVSWRGGDPCDVGTIIVTDNVVSA